MSGERAVETPHNIEATWDEKTERWFHVCRTCWVSCWDPAPELPCQGGTSCAHDWLDRPESDTRECLICGEERSG